MAKKNLGVLVGLVIAIALGFLIGARIDSEYVRYVSVFLGSIATGAIIKEQGWLYGGIVGLLLVVVLGIILSRISLHSSNGQIAFPLETKVLLPAVSTVVSGVIGGVVGNLLKKS